jgi:hypothetical protein
LWSGEKPEHWIFLGKRQRFEDGDLVLTWTSGQNSIHDHPTIPSGRDVGNVVAQRHGSDGRLVDTPYDVTFAFRAFWPDGEIVF